MIDKKTYSLASVIFFIAILISFNFSVLADSNSNLISNGKNAIILKQWIDKISSNYKASPCFEPQFRKWSKIKSDSLNLLFPDYQFFTISWDEQLKKSNQAMTCYGRAFQIYQIIAINEHANDELIIFYGSGNYEQYGDFLAKENIQINNENDAKNIWQAFCDIHQKSWVNNGILKIKNQKNWHLGISVINNIRYYYDVQLNNKNTITSAKLKAVRLK